MARHNETISYDEVAEWWENSDWFMSTYPPSAWHKYCEREGIDIDELKRNAAKIEDGVEEMVAEGDGRTCDCQWAGHEDGCTWSPHEGHTGHWSSEFWRCDNCKETT